MTLPSEDLARNGIEQGDYLAGRYRREEGVLAVGFEPFPDADAVPDEAFALRVTPVGGSLGVTIPSDIRDEHDLAERDSLALDRDGDAYAADLGDAPAL